MQFEEIIPEGRTLTAEEIGQLILQGCSADNWNRIVVAERFVPENIRNVRFSGINYLGLFDEEISLFGGITFKRGIYNAWLHNCIVEDNVLIHNVRSYIANYRIGRRAKIHNITTLAVDGESCFGNGVMVQTINESGGREVPICDFLSAHVAYMIALYRHRSVLVSRLMEMIADYSAKIKSDFGIIGEGAKIINCDTIKNVKIGPAAVIEGARKLQNGSVNSSVEDPVVIGDDVIMEDFIVCSGSRVTDATLISKCFIGQGCILDKHYSAVESLFFANCQGFHGEACSIFAGPYTVTHHKSTLLIAGMFSFMNAGSGSNQSNHLYKIGPVHQGVLERGSKTTSDSYILWPSHIGAFSLVMGRHYKHSDTSDFPFSYLIEHNDETVLVPAINLKSIGIIRDSQKWPKRDRRKDFRLLDYINYNLLSPYTVQKMLNGYRILQDLLANAEWTNGICFYKDMQLLKHSAERGLHFYEMAIWKFLGNSIITRLSGKRIKSVSDIAAYLKPETQVGKGEWIDLSGLICPAEALEKLLESIETKTTRTLEEIDSVLRSFHSNYYNFEWTWAYRVFEEMVGKPLAEFSINDLVHVVRKWKESVLEIDNNLYADAMKEFSDSKMTGFGIDGIEADKVLDFEVVRGDFSNNDIVAAIKEHMRVKTALGDGIIEKLEALSSEKRNVCVE